MKQDDTQGIPPKSIDEGKVCPTCIKCVGKMHPSHNGSPRCESGSIASGGDVAHCTCDICF